MGKISAVCWEMADIHQPVVPLIWISTSRNKETKSKPKHKVLWLKVSRSHRAEITVGQYVLPIVSDGVQSLVMLITTIHKCAIHGVKILVFSSEPERNWEMWCLLSCERFLNETVAKYIIYIVLNLIQGLQNNEVPNPNFKYYTYTALEVTDYIETRLH